MRPKKEKVVVDRSAVELQKYKKRVAPLLQYLRSKSVSFHYATVGASRIEYFRLDEFTTAITTPEPPKQLQKLLHALPDILWYYRRPKDMKGKYPSRLEEVSAYNEERKYASFRYDTSEWKRWHGPVLVLLVVLGVFFPIWPMSVKYGVWLLAFSLTCVLVGITVVRLVLYALALIGGYEVWLFPKMYDPASFVGMFTPVIEVKRCESTACTVCMRVAVVVALLLSVGYVYANPECLGQHVDTTVQIVWEAHDWGLNKINATHSTQNAIKTLDDILLETKDIHEM